MKTSDNLYTWPKWMPLPQQNDYGYDLTDRRSKTDMEVGSVLRVNFDTDEGTVDCTLICNCTQALWLENFEQKYLRQGATWFKMPLQFANSIDWHTVRFATRPKAKLKGPRHTVYTFKLEFDKRELWFCEILFDMFNCITPTEFMQSVKFTKSAYGKLRNLQEPDWECWEKERRIKSECPENIYISYGAIHKAINNLKNWSGADI